MLGKLKRGNSCACVCVCVSVYVCMCVRACVLVFMSSISIAKQLRTTTACHSTLALTLKKREKRNEQTSLKVKPGKRERYRVYQIIRLNLGERSKINIFCVSFETQAAIFGAARSLPEIGSSLKLNHHHQFMIVQIPDTHCSMCVRVKERERERECVINC